jgi:hypothetical protein
MGRPESLPTFPTTETIEALIARRFDSPEGTPRPAGIQSEFATFAT